MIRTTLPAAALLAVLAAPVQAEVTEQSETHFVTRHAVDVAAQPKDVWLALIAPGDWWNDSHTWSADASNMTLTPQAGGCFCEKIPAEDGVTTFGLEGSVPWRSALALNDNPSLRRVHRIKRHRRYFRACRRMTIRGFPTLPQLSARAGLSASLAQIRRFLSGRLSGRHASSDQQPGQHACRNCEGNMGSFSHFHSPV